MVQIFDVATWVSENENRLFGFYETRNEDEYLILGYIREAIKLGNGEWLLGFDIVGSKDDIPDGTGIDYFQISDIRLVSYDWLQKNV